MEVFQALLCLIGIPASLIILGVIAHIDNKNKRAKAEAFKNLGITCKYCNSKNVKRAHHVAGSPNNFQCLTCKAYF